MTKPLVSELRAEWDYSAFFESFSDPKIDDSWNKLEKLQIELETEISNVRAAITAWTLLNEEAYGSVLTALRNGLSSYVTASNLLGNLALFAHTSLSINTQDADAQSLRSKVQQVTATVQASYTILSHQLLTAPFSLFDRLLSESQVHEFSFILRHAWERKEWLLSEREETFLQHFAVDGLHAWGNLYTSIAGSLTCQIGETKYGIAEAVNLLSSTDPKERTAAWHATHTAWNSQEDVI